jgi:cytochrome P450
METPRVKRSRLSVLGGAKDMQEDIIAYGSTIWHEHGDYVRDRLLHKQCLFLFHPDALEHVLQKQNKRYTKDVFMFQAMKVILGEGLATSEGELWLKQRRLLQPFFLRAKVNAFAPIMIETVDEFLNGMKSREGSTVEMQREMDQLALMISVRTVFQNTSLDPIAFIRDLEGIGPDVTSYIRLPFPPLAVPTPRNKRLKHKIDLLDGHIKRVMRDREENPISGELDALQTLIKHNDPQQVRDELMTLIVAGYQTTSLSLSFAWSLLAQHPSVAQKLRNEVDAVLGNRALTQDDLPQFEYARAVFMETLRLYPSSFGLIRQATQNDVIAGHTVAAGTVMCMAPYFTHRHPAFWTDPERFDPERFLPGGTKPQHKYAYLPFGAGPHMCMGNHFALVEALIILVMLSRQYTIRFADASFQPEVLALAVMKMKELPMVFEAR